MILRIAALLLILSCASPVFGEEENANATPTPSPGFFHRVTHIFHWGKDKSRDKKNESKKLELSIDVSPLPLKLSETHELQVVLKLANHTGKIVQLNFPTTQRIEVLLRNDSGKIITQWSENQAFTNDAGYVTINPGERVEYSASISGRDLVPGKRFTVEGFLPNYENLRAAKTITADR